MSAGKVYSAVYSGVQVYEMMIHGIATMVRGEDCYINATQILKVAGFEKTRRTKILEREVLIGEHEKVQGGYGKYQGTWIPFEKGKELAEKYDVLDRLLPLLNFDPSTLLQENTSEGGGATLEERARLARTSRSPEPVLASPSNALILPVQPVPVPLSSLLSSSSSSSSSLLHSTSIQGQKRIVNSTPKHQQVRKKMKLVGILPEPIAFEDAFYEHHRSLLMSLFLSDNPDDTPSLLASALLTKDINIDLVIDEQGHTALHWAAALGRAKIVDLLIKNGANTCRVNYEGETPLMRAAMINCCYDNKCFTEMVDMMADSITVTDKHGRTVLHHIALTATVKGYTDAAIYYMKRFVKAVPKKSIIKNILNVRDTQHYESALAIALRVECQDIVDILIKQGALDPLISNIEEDEGLQFEPINYESNSKGQEIMKSIQFMVEKMEKDYQEKLKKRDVETFEIKKELNMVKYELKEAHRRLELPVSMQLAEARRKIHELENKAACDHMTIGEMKLEQDSNETENPSDKSTKERKLEKKVKSLQNQVETGSKAIERLHSELEEERKLSNEKEMQYRRLIATSCGLPIEKVDALVQPLTLAIESDPPDLDMVHVIGFMERLRRQKTSSTSNASSPRGSNTTTTPV